MLSGRTVPNTPIEPPMVWVVPGVMLMMLVPNCVNSATTKRRTPSPMEVSSTTAATPTAMPSAVSTARMRCANTDPPVNFTRSAARTAQRLPASATTGSRRAARRAGNRPNTTPLSTATTSASTTAQAGAPTGSAG